ncbi:MAG: metal-dependent transcriptional regulator [Caldilineaceae bacterium]|nr:metal-dependent transcriptional regulator [Caldilineaceae bacterium]HRJ42558.1 metal-dependent transcriptional regulator [Caldilineaceae bacterium]
MTKNYVYATENPLTPAHEDYLKAIYLLESNGELVSNSALAQHMGFAPASATNMVKKLAELHLVTHEPYRGVELTALGRQVALEVLRHHRLIELFLHETLAMSWDRVHEEADKLEHVISEAMEDAMAAVLGNPTVDPHGDPIPSKEGHVDKTPGFLLTGAAIDARLRLIRVLTQDPDRLCYLGSLGLYPDAQLVLRERAPLEGPLLVEVNGKPHALAYEMAESLQVVVAELVLA